MFLKSNGQLPHTNSDRQYNSDSPHKQHMGGSKSKELDKLVVKLWEWCIARNIWISAVHIARRLNTRADEKSHVFSDNHEWMLNKHSFNDILSHYPGLDFDLFASWSNYQISSYCSWHGNPNSAHLDTFTMNWSGLIFSLVSSQDACRKLAKTKHRVYWLRRFGQPRRGSHFFYNTCATSLGFYALLKALPSLCFLLRKASFLLMHSKNFFCWY